MIYYFFLTVITFIISITIIFNSNKIAKKLKIIDNPSKNSIHFNPIPKTGGLIILTVILLNYFLFIYFGINISDAKIELLCLSLVFLVGLIDDSINLKPLLRIFLIILISIILITLNEKYIIKELIFYNFNDQSIYLKKLSFIFTIFCILVFCNAFNFIDGINGLSISAGLIWIVIVPLSMQENILIILSLLIILFFNLKNKIFLGNSGASILSFYISINYIKYYNENKFLYADQILIFFLIPGLDLIRLFVVRIMKQKSPFNGDLNHLHHLMLKYFNSDKKALISCIVIITAPILLSTFTNIKSLYIVGFSTLFYFFIIGFLKKKLT